MPCTGLLFVEQRLFRRSHRPTISVPIKSGISNFRSFLLLLLTLCFGSAAAHVSEQGLVLLLPTRVYIASGVLVVVLTLLLLLTLPPVYSSALFSSVSLRLRARSHWLLTILPSLISLITCCVLLWIGFTGTLDPLENLLPLVVWTVWWVGLAIIQGVVGDIWRSINPWSGIYSLAQLAGWTAPFKLSVKVGQWPGVVLLLLFMAFALADPAPDDPQRLALITLLYWCFTLLCMFLFGESWLHQGECFSIMLRRFSELSIFGFFQQTARAGLPGWKLTAQSTPSLSAAVFIFGAVRLRQF